MNTSENIQIVAKLDKIVVCHNSFMRAVDGIKECISKSLAYREPVGCILTGKGGYGKTTICKVIMSKMPKYMKHDDGYEKTIIPAFYCAIPSPATVKSVAAALLRELHDPNPLVGTTAQLTRRLCHLLKQCETQLVFLDEFHHLFDVQKTSTKVNSAVCNWIKSLVNETGISFCLVGTTEFAPILAMDSQLIRRFPVHYSLTALKPSRENKNDNSLKNFFIEISSQIKRIIEVDFSPELYEPKAIEQLYAATGGNPAFLMAIIKEALLFTRLNNGETVTQNDFALAWDNGLTANVSLTKSNPFRMTAGELAGNLRNKYAFE